MQKILFFLVKLFFMVDMREVMTYNITPTKFCDWDVGRVFY